MLLEMELVVQVVLLSLRLLKYGVILSLRHLKSCPALTSSPFWYHLSKHGAILGSTRGATGGSLGGAQRGPQRGPFFGVVLEGSRLAVLRVSLRGATQNMGGRVGPKGKG